MIPDLEVVQRVKLSIRSALSLALLAASTTVSPGALAFGALVGTAPDGVRALSGEVLFVDGPGPELAAIVKVRVERTSQPFAWLIPSRGRPRISRSSSVVLRRLSEATVPEHLLEVKVSGTCKAEADPPAPAGSAPGVARSSRLEGEPTWLDLSSDPDGVVGRWLTNHGFAKDPIDPAALRQLAEDGFGLLALRLTPVEHADYTPTVALSYEASLPSLPPRFTRTDGELAFRVWVVSPSHAVPLGAPSLVLNEARIDWTTGTTYPAGTLPANGSGLPFSEVREPANYAALVRAAAAEAGGSGFVTELAIPVSQIRQSIWSKADEERTGELIHRRFGGVAEAVAATREVLGEWDDPDLGDSAQSATVFLRLVRRTVTGPLSAAAEELRKAPYLTRLYGFAATGAPRGAVSFDSNPELAQVPKARMAQQRVQCDPSIPRRDAPWRIHLPHGGTIAGRGPGAPSTVEALPANLRVVTLSTSGPGTIVKDNRALVESRLLPDDGVDRPHSPQLGLRIAGDPSLSPVERRPPPPPAPKATPRSDSAARCSTGPSAGAGAEAGFIASFVAIALFLRRRRRWATLLAALVVLAGCTGRAPHDDASTVQPLAPSAPAASASSAVPVTLPPEALRLEDPKSCKPCHPMHYREWSGSMHAYATDDPVFVAMNARGQRETGGKLGDFCFRCHAPMAVRHGTADARTDPRALPEGQRGVTCYFCHNVTAIEGDHNGQLRIAGDDTMRGPIKDPARTTAHRTAYSDLFDEFGFESSRMCGGCHDIVTPNGVELERTFREYRHGIFSKSATGDPPAFDSCVGCHMAGELGFAANGMGLPQRTVHKHFWPGVDVAVTDFPQREAMRSAVERCALPASISFFTVEVTPPDLFTFQIETNAGHNQPSGASQDRRMWLEVTAYDARGNLLEKASSGRIADGALEEHPPGHPDHDPNLLLFGDRIFDAKGKPVHMFWEAEKSPLHPHGFESNLLPAANVTYLPGRHAIVKQYRISGPGGLPARVVARLKIRPIGMDVLRDLVASGDLDEAVLAQMPTLDFGHRLEWTPKKGLMRPISATLARANCEEFKCLLEPGSKHCVRATAPDPETPEAPRSPLDPYGY